MDRIRARWWSGGQAGSPHLLPDERGFTIVEALIASVVFTVALVALAELLTVSVRMEQLGQNGTTAARLAQDKFEELMKLNFDTNPAIQVSAVDTLSSNVANYFDTPATSGFTRRWRVQAGPNARLRIVTVRVLPDNPSGGLGGPFTLTSLVRSW